MVILTVNASYSDPHSFILRTTASVGLIDQHLSVSTKPGFEKGLFFIQATLPFYFSAITKTLLIFVYYPHDMHKPPMVVLYFALMDFTLSCFPRSFNFLFFF